MDFSQAIFQVAEHCFPSGGRAALSVFSPNVFCLQISPAEGFEAPLSYAFCEDLEMPDFEADVDENEAGAKVDTGKFRVSIEWEPFRLKVVDERDNPRFESRDLEIREGRVRFARAMEKGEAVYGLGEHGETFNRNPGRYRTWNVDEPNHQPFRQYYCTIPFGVSHPGGAGFPHGFFVDNPGEVNFDVGKENPEVLWMETKTGDLRLWLIFGETPVEVLAEWAKLTGRMERPPLWSLGYHQCRWSYPTAERIREVTGEFRKRRIPCDGIWFDIDYMDDFAVFTWHHENFSDPKGLIADLKNDGFRTVTIVDPGVKVLPGYQPYDEGLATEGFFIRTPDGEIVIRSVWPGKTHFPDFTNPATRERWGDWQAEMLLDYGVEGVWNDMNEPSIFEGGDFPAHAVQYDFGRYTPHHRLHNIYGLTMARASWEGQERYRPERRPFCLTRSGWAGIQKWSAVWTGDNRSAFTCMPLDLAVLLNLGMSGVPFAGCDIGGFASDATPELIARWMEWGVFQPFCRGHSAMGTKDQEPWALGPGTERISRQMLELRYSLLPYIYTTMVESADSGLPAMRPLALEFPEDATVASIGDQFLLGSSILVAPMMEPGRDHRLVYLPAGTWYHYFSGKSYEGGSWIGVPAQPGKPPVFIRAGSVLPMHSVRQTTMEPEPETTFLDVWPGRRIAGDLVEDDGVSTKWRDGEEARFHFSGETNGNSLKLLIPAPEGPYRSARKEWTVRLHQTDRKPERVLVNGTPADTEFKGDHWAWTIPDERKAVEIEVGFAG